MNFHWTIRIETDIRWRLKSSEINPRVGLEQLPGFIQARPKAPKHTFIISALFHLNYRGPSSKVEAIKRIIGGKYFLYLPKKNIAGGVSSVRAARWERKTKETHFLWQTMRRPSFAFITMPFRLGRISSGKLFLNSNAASQVILAVENDLGGWCCQPRIPRVNTFALTFFIRIAIQCSFFTK